MAINYSNNMKLFGEQTKEEDEEKVTIEIILIVNNTNCLPYLLSFHYSHLKCPLDDTQQEAIPRQERVL